MTQDNIPQGISEDNTSAGGGFVKKTTPGTWLVYEYPPDGGPVAGTVVHLYTGVYGFVNDVLWCDRHGAPDTDCEHLKAVRRSEGEDHE